ncbi:MAG: carotenoid biosynthesis protein [Rubrobacter sp.]
MDTVGWQRLSPAQLFSNTPKPLLLGAAFFFVAALFAANFPDAPGRSVASVISTAAMAAPTFIALVLYTGPGLRRGLLALVSLGAFGYAIEAIGVTTGLPYGDFVYSDALGGKLFGLVPYLLPVSYVPLVVGAVAATWRAEATSTRAAWLLRSTLLLVLMDGVLDPGAAALGFWVWEAGGFYYGIPASNYFGWFISGLLASFILSRFGRWETPPRAGMLDGAILGLSFWVGVAVFSGFIAPVLLGLGLLVYLIRVRSRLIRGTTV